VITKSAHQIVFRQQNGIGPQHAAQSVALALNLTGFVGWAPLCCWCLDKPQNERRSAFRIRASYGECSGCNYNGRDCLLAAPQVANWAEYDAEQAEIARLDVLNVQAL
jgi:hypothetical protein